MLDFSIRENLILEGYRTREFSRYGLLRNLTSRELAAKLIRDYDIRTPGPEVIAAALSGGNQQKVVVAREIERQPKLLIVAQPTQGLDIGAIEFVHRQLLAERHRGTAILLLSLELDEILALADRIAVIYEGEIMGILSRAEATEETLGLMMTGGLTLQNKAKEATGR